MANIIRPIVALLILTLCGISTFAQSITLDNTFNSTGKVTVGFGETGARSSYAWYVFQQPSGRIVVPGGHLIGSGGVGTPALASCGLTSSGALDSGFGTGGKWLEPIDADIRALEPLPNSQYLRLIFDPFPTPAAGLQRMATNGLVDGSFSANLNVGADVVPVAARSRPDGKILVLLRAIGNDYSHWLIRLNAQGSRDASFGVNGVRQLNLSRLSRFIVKGLHPLPDNRIVVGGKYSTSSGPAGGGSAWAAILDEDGHVDRRFGLQGVVRITPEPTNVFGILDTLLQPDGKIVLIGVWRNANTSRMLLIRLTRRGRLDTGFGQNGIVIAPNLTAGSFEVGYSGALMSDGRVVVTGSHAPSQTGMMSFMVARFSATGVLEASTITEFTAGHNSVPMDVMVQTDGKIVAAGYTRNPDASADGTAFAIARYNQQ